MVLLDTSVVSGLWKPKPEARVVAWLNAQVVETAYLSAIMVAGLRFGIAAMSRGKRCAVLGEQLGRALLPLFASRVLPFDLAASGPYAKLMARTRAAGRPVGRADGYVSAIAVARGFTVATRDVAPFETTGLSVINLWGEKATLDLR